MNEQDRKETLPDYAAVKEYLYGLKHRGATYGIDRMRLFSAALGYPERKYPVVHVAGTNGKGSTSAMLESIFRAAGCHTGLFTSPHLVHQGERVQVDRQIMSHADIAEYTRRLRPVAEEIEAASPDHHPTFFEFMTGMAFLRFAEIPVDVAVIETGLGGRLDATNIVQPALTIITSISLDHTDILGDRIEQIAAEKAGILKAGVPVVIGHMPAEAAAVIRDFAERLGCPFHSVEEHFGSDLTGYPESALPGDYQRYNAACAVLGARILGPQLGVSELHIQSGLKTVNWAGRWETHDLGDRKLILDASHNPEGAEYLDRNLARLYEQTGVRPVIFAGTLGHTRAQSLMPVVARHAREIHLLRPHQPRACSYEELESFIPASFTGRVVRGKIRDSFPFPGFCVQGTPGETLVATGSIYLIGEIMEALYHELPVGEQALQD